MARHGRKIETCVFPLREGPDGREVFLGRMRDGLNAGAWLPVGSLVGEDTSPLLVARADVARLGLAIPTEFLGVATEIGEDGVWQTLLFLYRIRLSEGMDLDVAGLSEFDESRWFTEPALADIQRPQADVVFSTTAFALAGAAYEVTLHFDAANHLFAVDPTGSPPT